MLSQTQTVLPSVVALLAYHAEQLEVNEYTFFELTYARQTGWVALVARNSHKEQTESHPLARGSGATAEIAARLALESIKDLPVSIADMRAAGEQGATVLPGISKLMEQHNAFLPVYPNAYFEIAHSRRTGWACWLCTDSIDFNRHRVILAHAGAETVDKAAMRTATEGARRLEEVHAGNPA
ncbi:hypothetical protein [Ralstonia pseudosolanacearum]|uniref:hypothetical protein n=1 Tax=Ralstonia pseudosolanacearum TaxID=1310165 RepID=UPI003CE9D126